MADQTGDGITADTSSAGTNLLASPVSKVFLINRGSVEVRVRVVWQTNISSGSEHGSGHTGSNYATMRTNEPRTFGSDNPGHPKIKGLFVHTGADSSTVDFHVKNV